MLARCALVVVAAAACGDNLRGERQPDPHTPMRVLFLGNSITATHDLPAVVTRLASPSVLEVAAYTPGGYRWEDHEADVMAVALLAQPWDVVVLQDATLEPLHASIVKPAARALAHAIGADDARIVLLETPSRPVGQFPAASAFEMNQATTRYYAATGAALAATVAPVGRAWQRAIRAGWRLHQPDEIHPNELGTYLAACVVLAVLTGHLPAEGDDGGLPVSSSDAVALQAIAAATLDVNVRLASPLVGEWPLDGASRVGPGGDLATSADVELGDVRGPSDGHRGTTFGAGRYAHLSYLAGARGADLTVALDVFRADWSAWFDEDIARKGGAFSIAQAGHRLEVTFATEDPNVVVPDRLAVDVAAWAPGWHHVEIHVADANRVSLWLDGVHRAGATLAFPLSLTDPESIVSFDGIGIGSAIASDRSFTGAVAMVRLYDRP